MTDWSTRQAASREAQFRTFGEEVVLPAGAVQGLVDLYAEELPRRSRAPGVVPLGAPQTPRPIVYLASVDAAAVELRDELVIRGVSYLAVSKDAEDGGLVRVELMRKPADADQTQYDRWQ